LVAAARGRDRLASLDEHCAFAHPLRHFLRSIDAEKSKGVCPTTRVEL